MEISAAESINTALIALVPRRLEELRMRSQLAATYVHKLTGINIRRIERGLVDPTLRTLTLVLNVYGYTLFDFFFELQEVVLRRRLAEQQQQTDSLNRRI